MLKPYHFVVTFVVILVLGACSTNSPVLTPMLHKQTRKKNIEFKIEMSNEGEHLFNVLVDKKTEKFVKQIKRKQKYDENRHELIKVYNSGLYPSFPPDQIASNKTSIFKGRYF